MKSLFILVCTLLISGCATNQELVHTYFKNYQTGETNVVYVGEPILRVKDAYLYREKGVANSYNSQATPSENFTIEGSFSNFPFSRESISFTGKKGKPYGINGTRTIDGVNYDMVRVVDWKGIKFALLVDKTGTMLNNKIYSVAYDHIESSLFASVIPNTIRFTKSDKPLKEMPEEETKDITLCHINYELIYGGINDVTLTTTYKEYALNDFARPAFFQNLVFETKAKQIRYKNTKIDIIKADNEKIEYRVVDDGLKTEVTTSENTDYINCQNELMYYNRLR